MTWIKSLGISPSQWTVQLWGGRSIRKIMSSPPFIDLDDGKLETRTPHNINLMAKTHGCVVFRLSHESPSITINRHCSPLFTINHHYQPSYNHYSKGWMRVLARLRTISLQVSISGARLKMYEHVLFP